MKAVIVIAAAFLAPLSAVAASRSASMTITALVQPSTTFTYSDDFQQLDMTNIDLSKGYLDVPGTFQFVVDAGTPMQRVLNVPVEVKPDPELIQSIEKLPAKAPNAAQSTARASTQTTNAQQNASGLAPGFRLLLTDEAKTGNFSVPVTVTINL